MRLSPVRVVRPLFLGLVILSCAPERALSPTLTPGGPSSDISAAAVSSSSTVVISQVYGGGGNNGGVYSNDFIELFNRGTEEISLVGWSVQYTSAAGPTAATPNWSRTILSGSIAPGQYRLIQEAPGANTTQLPLPSPDIITGSGSAFPAGVPIAMGATAGKVALVRNTTPLTCGSATNPCSVEVKATIADLVGYGTGASGATFFEGTAPAGTLTNSTAAVRVTSGCTDNDDNGTDFNVATPSPRNGQSARVSCDVTPPPPPPPGLPDTRFVELHYDNVGSDVNEALEIEGLAGFSVTGWSVVLYNGTGGAAYDTRPLSGTIPDMCNGRGVIALRFEPDGIQNGSPDGFALVNAAGETVEFLSYEGTFAATNGPVAGKTSVNIGVSEPATTSLGHSMRRDATGVWQAPAAGNSIGACNSGVGPAPPAYQNISFTGRTAADIALPVGFQDQVFASVIDEKGDAVETSITWLAETPGLAGIDERGVITALAAGTPQFRATTGQGFTRILSLPTQVPTPSTTAQYGNNAEFGEPADGDASDDFIVRRAQYTSSYNENRGTPNWVSYDLDATHIGSLDRCDCFTFDPALPQDFPRYNTADYTGVAAINGYSIDRGHLARSFDRTTGSLDNATTFYFSNIIPQASDLNQGPWAVLESNLGDSARFANREVYIITGVAGEKGTVKNEGKITIPAKVWKVAVLMPRDNGLANVHDYTDLTVIAVIMPNDPGVRNVDWTTYKTTVDKVEALSGYDLLDKLDDRIEILVESGDRPPVAVWGGSTTGLEGSPVSFDAGGSSDADVGDALTYGWDFGDGTKGTGVNPTHAFHDNGVYNVVLTVKDPVGAEDSQARLVTITNATPVVKTIITITPTVLSGETVFAIATFGDAGVNDNPWSYVFDWGAGSISTGSTGSQSSSVGSSRSFFAPGTYSVGFTVTDKDLATSVKRAATFRVLAISAAMSINPQRVNINGQGNGQVIVTLFGSSTIDAAAIDLESVRIGTAGIDTRGNAGYKSSVEDANSDGIADLIVHFERSDLIGGGQLRNGVNMLVLRANLNDGRQIEARGAVNVGVKD